MQPKGGCVCAMEQQEQPSKAKRLKIAIIILAVLLILSGGGLAARYIYLEYFAPAQITATVPDNLIGDSNRTDADSTSTENTLPAESGPDMEDTSEGQTDAPENSSPADSSTADSGDTSPAADKPSAPVLELYAGRPDANRKFEVSNMLPGDVETQYFCVRAYHDANITLFFRADVTGQTKNLGDVLHIRVTHLDSGKVLCDAPFAEIEGKEFSELLTANAQKETVAYYQIDVSLDTSVDNEYQAAKLLADFSWYVKDEGELTPPPQTGDTTNLVLWAVLAASSLLLLIFLWKRRKEEGRHA